MSAAAAQSTSGLTPLCFCLSHSRPTQSRRQSANGCEKHEVLLMHAFAQPLASSPHFGGGATWRQERRSPTREGASQSIPTQPLTQLCHPVRWRRPTADWNPSHRPRGINCPFGELATRFHSCAATAERRLMKGMRVHDSNCLPGGVIASPSTPSPPLVDGFERNPP